MSARQVFLRVVILAAFVPFVCSGCFMGVAGLGMSLSRAMAHALLPPEYPGSKVLDTHRERMANSESEWRIYHTTDDPQVVLAFMEKHMPGFTQDSNGRHYNSAADTGLLAQFAEWISGSGGLPTAGVRVYASEHTGTTIEISWYWPSP